MGTFLISGSQTFASNTTIIRFKELKYFIGIGDVGSGANSECKISGCTKLRAISTPAGAILPMNAFMNCGALEELEIDSNADNGFIDKDTYNPNIKVFKVGEHATQLNQSLSGFTKITTVDIGSQISSLPNMFLRGTKVTSLTLRYNGRITPPNQMFYNVTAGTVDLYVPSDRVGDYANYDAAIKAVHAITE